MRRIVLAAALPLVLASCAQTVKLTTTYPPGSVPAHVARPSGSGPFPAVVLLHGGTGIEPNHMQWASWLATEGYLAVVVDSIRAGAPANLAAYLADARGALEYLRQLPIVDRERIAIMSFSRSSGAALASVTRFRDTPPPPADFRAAVLFYPIGCSARIDRAEAPLLVLFGALDDAVETCTEMRRRLQRIAGHPVTVIVYPNAYHAFDDERATTVATGRGAEGAVTVKYDPHAAADARVRVKNFLAEHLRVGRPSP